MNNTLKGIFQYTMQRAYYEKLSEAYSDKIRGIIDNTAQIKKIEKELRKNVDHRDNEDYPNIAKKLYTEQQIFQNTVKDVITETIGTGNEDQDIFQNLDTQIEEKVRTELEHNYSFLNGEEYLSNHKPKIDEETSKKIEQRKSEKEKILQKVETKISKKENRFQNRFAKSLEILVNKLTTEQSSNIFSQSQKINEQLKKQQIENNYPQKQENEIETYKVVIKKIIEKNYQEEIQNLKNQKEKFNKQILNLIYEEFDAPSAQDIATRASVSTVF